MDDSGATDISWKDDSNRIDDFGDMEPKDYQNQLFCGSSTEDSYYFSSAVMNQPASPYVSPSSITISPPLSASSAGSTYSTGQSSDWTVMGNFGEGMNNFMSLMPNHSSAMVDDGSDIKGNMRGHHHHLRHHDLASFDYTYDMDYNSNEEFSSNEMDDFIDGSNDDNTNINTSTTTSNTIRKSIRHCQSMDSVTSMSSLELENGHISTLPSSGLNGPTTKFSDSSITSNQGESSSVRVFKDMRSCNDLVKKGVYTEWVKLSRMTPHRVERIKALGKEKGIDAATVEAVLTLYANTQRIDNDINRYRGEDVYIKITMGSALLEEPELLANGGSGSSIDEDTGLILDGVVPGSGHLGLTKLRRKSSLDDMSLNAPPPKQHRRSKSANYVKRPLNSFMLYRRSQTQSAMAFAMSSQLKLNHQNISQIIGLMWQTESKEIKDEFAKFAGQEKDLHKILYPDYKFCPQKRRKRSVG